MSALVQDLQKQNPNSSLVILYEIELSSSSPVFFHSGENVGSTITFKIDKFRNIPLALQEKK